jgi:hypothetical protein
MHRPLYPRYPLDKRLGGAQYRHGRHGGKKNLTLPDTNSDRSAVIPATTLRYYPEIIPEEILGNSENVQ